MIKYDGTRRFVLGVAVLLVLIAVAQAAFALPSAQFATCGPGTDCYEPVSPEPDEYYAITCNTNTVWVWATVPAPTFLSAVTLVQILGLPDGGELAVPNELTLTLSGDTVTISGSNGNRAPEAGSKSFSLNECIARNGGLPEIPGVAATPDSEQQACLDLPTEAEIVQCLQNLIPDYQTCEFYIYAQTHQEECGTDNCTNFFYAAQHQDECRNEDTSYEILFALVNACFNPVGAGAAVISFAAFRSRLRRRK